MFREIPEYSRFAATLSVVFAGLSLLASVVKYLNTEIFKYYLNTLTSILKSI